VSITTYQNSEILNTEAEPIVQNFNETAIHDSTEECAPQEYLNSSEVPNSELKKQTNSRLPFERVEFRSMPSYDQQLAPEPYNPMYKILNIKEESQSTSYASPDRSKKNQAKVQPITTYEKLSTPFSVRERFSADLASANTTTSSPLKSSCLKSSEKNIPYSPSKYLQESQETAIRLSTESFGKDDSRTQKMLPKLSYIFKKEGVNDYLKIIRNIENTEHCCCKDSTLIPRSI